MTGAGVTITPLENGPNLVQGRVTVRDADGAEYEVGRETMVLRRCAGSTNKPFCDGTHSKAGLSAAERAVRQQDEQES